MKKDIYIEIAAGLIVLLFMYASASKLFDLQSFIHEMERQPLPLWLKRPLVWIVPGTEILVSAALLFPKTRLAGFYAAAVLLFAFTCYTVLVLSLFFGKIPCSCGGVIKSLSWPQHLLLNLFFLLLAVAAIMYQRRPNKRVVCS